MLFTEVLIRHSLGGMTVKYELHAVVMFAQNFCVGFCIMFAGVSGLTLLHLCIY